MTWTGPLPPAPARPGAAQYETAYQRISGIGSDGAVLALLGGLT